MSSIHRLGRGLLGYLIPFATHAFVSQRQDRSSKMPSHLVFLSILTHFTATPTIPLASPGLDSFSIDSGFPIESGDLTIDLKERLQALYAQ